MDAKSEVSDALFHALVTKLQGDRFFGTVETHFENGRIVRIKKHETMLEDDVKRLVKV